jgi:hypothetical protein
MSAPGTRRASSASSAACARTGGGFAGGQVAVVPEARGQGVREPAVDVGLDVPARSPGQLVPGGLVSGTGFGLFQGVELA